MTVRTHNFFNILDCFSLPQGLKDVSAYPNLIEGLLQRGYSEADVRKILGENLLRVWQAVEDYAATTSTST